MINSEELLHKSIHLNVQFSALTMNKFNKLYVKECFKTRRHSIRFYLNFSYSH